MAACRKCATAGEDYWVLGASTRTAEAQWITVLVQRLRELGWIEGRSLAIEYRWAEGDSDVSAQIAAEFVRLKVDIIVTWEVHQSSPANSPRRSSLSSSLHPGTPLALAWLGNLARPGGNVTGLSNQQADIATKRLELLREVVPGLRRLAIMFNVDAPVAVFDMRGRCGEAASMLDVEVATSEVRQAKDIAPAFDGAQGPRRCTDVCTEPLLFTNRVGINILAAAARLPTMHGRREYVEAGGLMSMEQTSRTSFGAPPNMSTRFCME